eukprot:992019-Lingulodinium_polyedra.AAC.1
MKDQCRPGAQALGRVLLGVGHKGSQAALAAMAEGVVSGSEGGKGREALQDHLGGLRLGCCPWLALSLGCRQWTVPGEEAALLLEPALVVSLGEVLLRLPHAQPK